MTVPQWALLGFAVWTLLVLFGTIGVYRWSRILTGRVAISEWRADVSQGGEWYRRAIRAHMNCVENLPVFAAIVFCVSAAHAETRLVDLFSLCVIGGRIAQTSVHLLFPQSNLIAAIRFGFFLVQALCMIGMATVAALVAASS